MSIATIIALIGLIIVILVHLCGTVWWMSKITTKLDIFIDTLKETSTIAKQNQSKEQCRIEHVRIDSTFKDLWDAINDLKSKS